ncbi:hypothetical protein [Nocardioides zeae]|uniref:H domain protein n=1 Tax=Nocardioides zeae TaxID=1457234 RepID=A0A6P0HFW4_9ACTN|nr:hypothetical protein [Nocardioides zeae]NEN77592.1 hypothetical protein [Nocardioides zeae]
MTTGSGTSGPARWRVRLVHLREGLPRRGGAVLVGGLVLALVAAAAALYRHNAAEAGAEREREAAVELLADRAAAVLSYTAATAESDLAAEEPWLTDELAEEIDGVTRSVILPLVAEGDVTQTARVDGAALENAGEDEVAVLVLLTLTTESTTLEAPRVSSSAMRVNARRDGDDWVIAEMTPL